MFDFDDLFKDHNKYLKVVFALIVLILFTLYLYSLLFGERSFSRLMELKTQEEKLAKRVQELQKKNEEIQKDYFELKELEGK